MGAQTLDEAELIKRAGVDLPASAKVTPMMRQWLEAKAKAKGAVLLFRMGDFYELFHDDAERAAPILELVITTRDRDKSPDEAMAMAGFPHHAAPAYIAKLIEAGLKVAVCDQLEDPALAKGIVKRDVTRVVTPGMVLEEEGLDARAPNYLVAVLPGEARIGLCAIELSTGEFLAGTVDGERALLDEVLRLNPSELVVPIDVAESRLVRSLARRGNDLPPRRIEARTAPGKKTPNLDVFGRPIDGFLKEASARPALLAAELALGYVIEAQGRVPQHLRPPRPHSVERHLLLDATTRAHLALVGPPGKLRDTGTLARVVDRTATAPGGRCLLAMLLAPSTNAGLIAERHDAVEALIKHPGARRDARDALRSVYDLERLTARVSSGRANPRDLGQLARSLAVLPELKRALDDTGDAALTSLAEGLCRLDTLADLLGRALVENPPLTLGSEAVFRAGFDPDLDELEGLAGGGRDRIAAMEESERTATGISNLKVKYTRVFGYYLEVTKTHLAKVPKHYRRKQTVANAERFVTDELAALEEQVAHAEQRRAERVALLFEQLLSRVAEHALELLDVAEAVARIDALASFAEVSDEMRFSRPNMLSGSERRLRIEEGRHPVVEAALKETGGAFVPSDIELSYDERQVVLVTGPNMAGKSTMMRQVALIQILAQAGCFVPAARADLSICDRIFTRVGASDDLAGGRSTFMVEMTETAHILANATDRSLLLLDEIGRGTATFDGLSLAWAVAEHIHDHVRARTLFATHYHELCDLAEHLDRVRNVHVVVKEWNDEIIFTRTIADGGAERSYGIQVARLAGLPAGVLARAREVLAELEGDAVPRGDSARPGPSVHRRRKSPDDQMDLFGGGGPKAPPNPYTDLAKQLVDVDVNRLTPLQALNALDKLAREARKIAADLEQKPKKR